MEVHKTNKTNQEQNLRIQTLLFPFAKKTNEEKPTNKKKTKITTIKNK